MGPDEMLYVTGPTLGSYDYVYRVNLTGEVEVVDQTFDRPQGLAFDSSGVLHVVEALAGVSGVYALPRGAAKELVVGGSRLVGLAFGNDDQLVVATSDTLYAFG